MGAARTVFGILLSGWLWLSFSCAVALEPRLDIDQYGHAAWRKRDGFPSADLLVLAQTPDGYLWFGTDLGLQRFDGVHSTPWQPPEGVSLPDARITALLVGRDGSLWIGTWRGLASWNHDQLLMYPQLEGHVISALAEDGAGTVWVGTSEYAAEHALLCAIQRGRTECYGKDGSLGRAVYALLQDRTGGLWVFAGTGLWQWQPDGPRLYSLLDPDVFSWQALTETRTGGTLFLTKTGVRQIIDGRIKDYWLATRSQRGHRTALLSDRDGSVWIGTLNEGLLHVNHGRLDKFGASDGLSGNNVRRVFEDREGNIWVATTEGLDRFSALLATTYSERQGVTGVTCAVLADRDGSVWFTTETGLYRWQGDHFLRYRAHHERAASPQTPNSGLGQEVPVAGLPDSPGGSLFQDHTGRVWIGTRAGVGYLQENRFVTVAGVPGGYIDSIVEDRAGKLWIAHRDAGLLELSADRLLQRIPWTQVSGSRGSASRLLADPARGGLWIGLTEGGIVHFIDGEVRTSYGHGDGLAGGRVNDLRITPDGAVWVATERGLSRLKDGRIVTLNARSGLPCDVVDSLIYDEGSIWLYSSCGLVHLPAAELESWSAAFRQGGAPQSKVRTSVLDATDGVHGFTAVSSFAPHVATTAEGKLWLAANDGLTVVELHRPPLNPLPPPIYIERLIADRKVYPASLVNLPPQARDLEIDYTALSLTAPEKVLFRYQLAGHDREWQNAGTRRQAFYSDLAPGNYRFRVIASNNSGVWNEQGAALDFTIAPAYWQTNWFRALCVLTTIGIIWTLYQLRLRRLTRTFNMTLEARVGERTRIARDLHDTLLQSLQGLLLRFRTVQTLIPTRPSEAQEILESAIDEVRAAVTESRSTVQGLRSAAFETSDFIEAIRTLGEALASDPAYSSSVALTLNIEGTPRALQPLVRDEIYRTASEALRNAYRHADATRVEVHLDYGERRFELRVRDDGKGIDPKFMGDEALPGHFGLRGMRERAKEIGGKLTIWSALGSGTELELSIPGSLAYTAFARARQSWLAGRFFAAKTTRKS